MAGTGQENDETDKCLVEGHLQKSIWRDWQARAIEGKLVRLLELTHWRYEQTCLPHGRWTGRSLSMQRPLWRLSEWSGTASRFTFLLSRFRSKLKLHVQKRISTHKNSTCEKNWQLRNNFWEVAATSNYPVTTFRAKATALLQNEANARPKPFLWHKKIFML